MVQGFRDVVFDLGLAVTFKLTQCSSFFPPGTSDGSHQLSAGTSTLYPLPHLKCAPQESQDLPFPKSPDHRELEGSFHVFKKSVFRLKRQNKHA